MPALAWLVFLQPVAADIAMTALEIAMIEIDSLMDCLRRRVVGVAKRRPYGGGAPGSTGVRRDRPGAADKNVLPNATRDHRPQLLQIFEISSRGARWRRAARPRCAEMPCPRRRTRGARG